MSGQKCPMTLLGHKKMSEELDHLKRVVRKEVIDAISEARKHGDLKENAEYHAAKEQQSFVEGRIAELEGKLGNAHVIDVTKIEPTGRVIFGVTVELCNIDSEDIVIYQIVGEDEADIKKGKVSVTAPLARALIGKEEGEIVELVTPSAIISYEIISVQHI